MTKIELYTELKKIADGDQFDDKEWYMKGVYGGCKTKQAKLLCVGRIRQLLGYTPESILDDEKLQQAFGNENIYDELVKRDLQSRTPPRPKK